MDAVLAAGYSCLGLAAIERVRPGWPRWPVAALGVLYFAWDTAFDGPVGIVGAYLFIAVVNGFVAYLWYLKGLQEGIDRLLCILLVLLAAGFAVNALHLDGTSEYFRELLAVELLLLPAFLSALALLVFGSYALEMQGKLLELSTRDALTGVRNRRYLAEAQGAVFAHARRTGSPVSFVAVDIDHFKRINDRYGHAAGDEVLKAVSAYLADSARTEDVVVRLGGEEFGILMPNTTLDMAARAADRLRQTVAASPIEVGPERLAATASFGVASAPDGAATLDALINEADQALYQSKHAGRNRVTLAPPATSGHAGTISCPPPTAATQ